jgi:tetratricopeptide (TPR) repeat protein
LLTLAAAYRETGQLAAAADALNSAEQQLARHIAAVPERMQPLMRHALHARLDAQRGLLRLAQQVDARGPLTWELEVAPPLPIDTAESITSQLRESVAAAEALTAAWRARASADAAAQNLANEASEGVELVALGQVSRAEQLLDEQQYHLALVLLEEGRARQAQPPGLFDSAWRMLAGGSDPIAQARQVLDTLTVTTPQDTPYLLADARALRLQYAADQADNQVYQRYDAIIGIDPQQPAAYYGKGQLALLDGDRAAARQLMQQALEQEPAYYPARLQLVAFAEQAGDWASALAHMQTLAQQYPGPQAELQLASILRRSGPAGFEEAASVLQPLVEAGNTAAMVEMGRLFAANQQPDAAISFYEQARAAETLAPQALLEMGHLLAETGEFARAEECFLQAIDTAQGETYMRASMAVAELYSGPLEQPERANDYYEQVLGSDVQDAATLLNIGNRLMQHGKPQRAAEVYRRADGLQPDNPRIAYGLSEALLALDEPQNASTQAQRVLDLTGTGDGELRAAALVNLGDVQRLSGNLENALTSYNQALALNAAHIEATLGLGQVAVARENWPVALGHFQQALNLPGGAESALAHFWYAEALLRQHSLTQAMEHYKQAHALQPHFPAALLGLAQAQFMRGSSTDALATIERALQQHPDYGEAWLFKGKLFQQQENMQAALAAYERAIEANNQLGEAYYRRGLIAMQQQEHEAAVSDLQRAADLQPDNAEIYYWLGQANFALNHMGDAAEAFGRAVELRNGSYAAAEFYLGMAEEARGQIDAAIASFESVIQQTNESEWVNRAQTELERIVNQ